MPVPILMKRRLSWSAQFDQCSPTAMMFTSLSTRTGTSSRSENHSGIPKLSHPGMIGGWTGRPVANSTGVGTPIPIPRTSESARPTSARSAWKRS